MSARLTSPQDSQDSGMDAFYAMLYDARAFAQELIALDTLPSNHPFLTFVRSVVDHLPAGPYDIDRSLMRIRESVLSNLEDDNRDDELEDAAGSDSSEDNIEQQLLSEGDDTHRDIDLPQAAPSAGSSHVGDDHHDVEQSGDAEQPVDGEVTIPPASSDTNVPLPADTIPPAPMPAAVAAPAPTPAATISPAPTAAVPAPLPPTLAATVPPAPNPADLIWSTATPAAHPGTTLATLPLCAGSTMRRREFTRSNAFLEDQNPSVFRDFKKSEYWDRSEAPHEPFEDMLSRYRESAKIAVRDRIGTKVPGASSSSAPTTSTAGPSRAGSSDDTSIASEPQPEAQDSEFRLVKPSPPETTSVANNEQARSTNGTSESCLIEPTPPETISVAHDEQLQSTTCEPESCLIEPTPPATNSPAQIERSQSVSPDRESCLVEPTPPETIFAGHDEQPQSTSREFESCLVEPTPPETNSPAQIERPQSVSRVRESCLIEPSPPETISAVPMEQPRLDKGKKRARDNEDDLPEPGAQTSAYTFDPEVAASDDKRPTKRSKRTAQAPSEASSSTIPAGPSKFFSSEDSSRKKSKKKSTPTDAPAPVVPETNGRPMVMIASKLRSRSVDIPDGFLEGSSVPKPAGKGKKRARADDNKAEPQSTGQADAPSPPKKARNGRTRTAAASQQAAPSRTRKVTKAPATQASSATASQPVAGPSRPRTVSRAPAAQTPRTTAAQPEPEPSRPRTAARSHVLQPSRGTRRSTRLSRMDKPSDVELEEESQDV